MADTEKVIYEIVVDSNQAKEKVKAFQGVINGVTFSPLMKAGEFIHQISAEIDKATGKVNKLKNTLFEVTAKGRKFASFKKVFGEGPFTTWNSTLTRKNQSTSPIAEIRRAWNRVKSENELASIEEAKKKGTTAALLMSPAMSDAMSVKHDWNNGLSTQWENARQQMLKDRWKASPNVLSKREEARKRLREKLGMDWETKGVSNARVESIAAEAKPVAKDNFRERIEGFGKRISPYVGGRAGKAITSGLLKMGPVGASVAAFMGSVLLASAAFKILSKIVTSLYEPLKNLAEDAFKFRRQRNFLGIESTSGLLTQYGIGSMMAGGTREEGIELINRIASERAGLLWGMGGGKYLEAAARFGVNIRGSGEAGLATEDEWMRAIAARMQELPQSGRIALANAAGLNASQMWQVSHGTGYYDWVTSRRTLSEDFYSKIPWIGGDTYTRNFQEQSTDFRSDWALFKESFLELASSFAQVLIPLVNLILEILSGIMMILNLMFKPILTILGKILSFLNMSHYMNQQLIDQDHSLSYMASDYGLLTKGLWSGPITTNVGDININSGYGSPKEVAQAVVDEISSYTDDIYLQIAGQEQVA